MMKWHKRGGWFYEFANRICENTEQIRVLKEQQRIRAEIAEAEVERIREMLDRIGENAAD